MNNVSRLKDEVIKISRDDLPALYHVATLASGEAQKYYLLLVKINVALLSFGAISSAINVSANSALFNGIIANISAVLLIGSVVITSAIELAKFEKKWYDGRAIAESIKTITWRFILNAEPYNTLSNRDAEERFRRDLLSIKNNIN